MTESERNTRISEEFERISVYFETLGENERAVISPLIQNAAFMRVALDDLQEIVSREGPVDSYQNGANQSGMKQSAALQAYNQLVKNYSAVIKTLFGLMPAKRPPMVLKYEPHIKAKHEKEEERRRDDEQQKRINAEIAAAAEFQRRQREGYHN